MASDPSLLKKINSVFSLLFFGELKDDVDDTLVQKLLTFLELNIRGNREFLDALLESTNALQNIPKVLRQPLEEARPTSICFALDLSGELLKHEDLLSSSSKDTLESLLSLAENLSRADVTIRASFIRCLTSLLQHEKGTSWITNSRLPRVVFEFLKDSSIFVQRNAEQFLVTCLISEWLNIKDFVTSLEILTHIEKNTDTVLVSRILSVIHEAALKSSLIISDSIIEKLLHFLGTSSSNTEKAADLIAFLSREEKKEKVIAKAISIMVRRLQMTSLIRFVTTILKHHNLDLEHQKRYLEIALAPLTLTAKIAAADDSLKKAFAQELADRRKATSLVTLSLSCLREFGLHISDPEIAQKVTESLFSFIAHLQSHSLWSRHSKILSLTLECLKLFTKKFDVSSLERSTVEQRFSVILPLLTNRSLTSYALAEALDVVSTLLQGIFTFITEENWKSCNVLVELGSTFQHNLVAIECDVIEVAMEMLAKLVSKLGDNAAFISWFSEHQYHKFVWDCLNSSEGSIRQSSLAATAEICRFEKTWLLLKSQFSLTEVNVITQVVTMLEEDTDVFVRRRAILTLHTWAANDSLHMFSEHSDFLHRAATWSVTSDLDWEIKKCGLDIWKDSITQKLQKIPSNNENIDRNVKEVFQKLNGEGFSDSFSSALNDPDRTVVCEGAIILKEVIERLEALGFSAELCPKSVPEDAQSNVVKQADTFSSHVKVNRDSVIESVLDMDMLECLCSKLREPDGKLGHLVLDKALRKENVNMKDLFQTSYLQKILDSNGESTDLYSSIPETLLDDILSAANTPHQDMDCY